LPQRRLGSVFDIIFDFQKNQYPTGIIRPSTVAALSYGEAHAAESKNDFIHKTSIVLKELRETQICLRLLAGSIIENQKKEMDDCQAECNQLVAIFHKTVMTAISNR